jgi:hypothetical protein
VRARRCAPPGGASTVLHVPVLSRCEAPACEVLTIGRYCVGHDAPTLSEAARERRAAWERVPEAAEERRADVPAAPVAAE